MTHLARLEHTATQASHVHRRRRITKTSLAQHQLTQHSLCHGVVIMQTLEPPIYDSWSDENVTASPAYLWMQCNDAKVWDGLMPAAGPAFTVNDLHGTHLRETLIPLMWLYSVILTVQPH